MISKVKQTALTVAFAMVSHMVQAKTPIVSWQEKGFEQPESIVFDEKQQHYYVSNISGTPMQANGKGFISLLSQEGKMIEKHWVDGMNAPKGMAQKGNKLFVADLQQLHIIDVAKGRLLQSLTATQSKMLNDIAIDVQGNVYVSDLVAGGIYRL